MKDVVSRYHFINLVKVTKDFLGERFAPLSEADCMALCSQTNMIDSINKALEDAKIEGIRIQLNWSEDKGNSWTQYPKSK